MLLSLIAISFTACGNKDNKSESKDNIREAFINYVQEEEVPDFQEISKIECIDSINFYEDEMSVQRLKFQIDSTKALATKKIENMTECFGKLSDKKREQFVTEFARLGAEYGELCVNSHEDTGTLKRLQEAIEKISPYKHTLYINQITAKIGNQDVTFFAFSVGNKVDIVKADTEQDALQKNKKLLRCGTAMMDVIQTELVPYSILIEDIDSFMTKIK